MRMRVGAFLGCVVLVLSASPALAKKKGKQRKKPAKLLSAGGFSRPVFSTGGPEMVFGESHVAGTGWFASATNAINQSGATSVNSQGICF